MEEVVGSIPISSTRRNPRRIRRKRIPVGGQQCGLIRDFARCTPRNGVKGAAMFAKNAKNPKTPAYRERVPYGQAIVTLTDAHSGQRKDYWLGEFNSPASREMYHRLVAEWVASGHQLPTDVPK